ncbi:MAG: hypothetical protein MJZ11_10920 [Lachnospiraceae bacterium]|nr:hypothetical protein [Lachnospiraceae bacterium]
MKKINKKTTKRVAAIILTAFAACSIMGCSVEKTVTTTETHTDADGNTITTTSTQTTKNGKVKNGTAVIEIEPSEAKELITYEFETFDKVKVAIEENSIIKQEQCDDPEHSDLISKAAEGNIIAPGRDYVYLEDNDYYYVADISRGLITIADKSKTKVEASCDESLDENPGFFETDSWSITYDTNMWYGYVNDEGNTIINYLGECAGTSLIEIAEVDVATAKEAIAMLEEKKGKELTVIDADEGAKYTCNAYAADEVYESGLYIADFYTIYEHNGKVIILDEMVTHDDDDSRAEALANTFLEVKNALVLK